MGRRGRWAGRGSRMGAALGAALGVLGAGLGVQARRQQVWQQALGCAGTARACADGRGASERTGAGALGAQDERAHRRWALAARGRARGMAGWAWPGRSLCAQAGPAGPGWGFVHSNLVFLARFDSVVS